MKLIKFFSAVDEDFVRQHFKDAQEAEKLIGKHRKKATIIMGVVASFMVVLLVALGFAMVKINQAKAEMTLAEPLQVQADQCMANAKQQAADAAAAQARAQEVNKNIQVLLKDCSQKRNTK